jgi:hypothetical protein
VKDLPDRTSPAAATTCSWPRLLSEPTSSSRPSVCASSGARKEFRDGLGRTAVGHAGRPGCTGRETAPLRLCMAVTFPSLDGTACVPPDRKLGKDRGRGSQLPAAHSADQPPATGLKDLRPLRGRRHGGSLTPPPAASTALAMNGMRHGRGGGVPLTP